MQPWAGFYFGGHTMRPITCEDRLGSYHYVKEGAASVVEQRGVGLNARGSEKK